MECDNNDRDKIDVSGSIQDWKVSQISLTQDGEDAKDERPTIMISKIMQK